MAMTTPFSTWGVQYSRWRRMTSASSGLMSEMKVGRGGTNLQRKCGIGSGEAVVEEGLELGEVFRREARGGRRRRRAPSVARALRKTADLGKHPFEIGLDEEPGAHVLGLLLAPDDLGFLEARQFLDQRLQGERIELLDAQKVDVVDAALLSLLIKVIVDLARAEDDAADLVVLGELDFLAPVRLGLIPQEPVEARTGTERLERRGGALVAQHRFWRHRDKRLAELPLQLPAQDVEEIRRRRAIDDLHVVLGAKLKVAFEAGG